MKKIIVIFFIFLFINTPLCIAQTFGKNKVTDRHFDWMSYKTSHFIIYYYPEAERLVRTMGDMAEIGYAKISDILEHNVKKQIPLILYKSHSDFQQTNIILETLEEGVGGFAELLKYRIVIPFTGSMDDFQKVITHEITHIFQYDILYKNLFAHIYTGEFIYSPPIWFIEGMAEYMSDNWGTDGEMVLRDAVITNSVVPLSKLQDWGPLGPRVYLGYKEGLSAFTYLSEKYGVDKIGEILRELSLSRTKDIDACLKNAIGIDMNQFDKEWMEYVKKRYWPKISDKQNPISMESNITEKNDSYSNTKPVWSPSGDLIAYIAYHNTRDEIRIISAKDGKLFAKFTGKVQDQNESIRDKGSGLAWSPDGDRIAFIGSKDSKDHIFIIDVVTGELVCKVEVPFDMAYSPSWSPDCNQIAFVGLKDGKSDIYACHIKDGKITQITSDAYDESSVLWHPSEQKLVYSSERNGRYKIFILNLDSKSSLFSKGLSEKPEVMSESKQITYGDQNDLSPSWTPDGMNIAFCSNMNGIYDVYTMDCEGKNMTRITNVLTGCFNPIFSPKGDSLALSIYHDYKNDIYILKSDDLIREKVDAPIPKEEEELYLVDSGKVRGVKYSLNFAPDLIYVNFGYISGGSLQNTVEFVASDIMGDHRFIASIDAISISSQPDIYLAYYYLRKRPDFGIAMFNWNEYYIEGSKSFWQRNTGIEGYISYPIDKSNRIDLQLVRYLRFRNYVSEDKEGSTSDSFNIIGASLVNDSITWSYYGPYSGKAYDLSLEQSLKLTSRDLGITNVILDMRKYFGLGKRSSFAFRGIAAASIGKDKENFYLGSSFRQSQGSFYFEKPLMRGYDFDEIFGTKVGLLNFEIRIPFLDELRFGFPVSWGIEGIRGVLFMDFAGVLPRPDKSSDIYGKAIISDEKFKPWTNDKEGFHLVDIKASVGAGFRIGPLSFDFAKKTDLNAFGKGYKFHFSLGQEF